ncbi:MAG: hypothetical protein ACYTGR_18865 [Planctomycetota bacterium]|jgi:hypothetical protein
MTRNERRNIGDSLRTLRRYVTVCWLLIGLAMATQVGVWAVVSFTDVRFAAELPVPLTVVEPLRSSEIIVPGEETVVAAAPVRMKSAVDQILADATGISVAGGTLAVLIMISMMSVTLMIAAASGRPGIDKLASAWIWTIVVAALTLPVYELVQLPWDAAALMSYQSIVGHQEAAAARGGFMNFNPYTPLLAVTCFLGMFVVIHRFRTGVERNIPAPEPLIDPALEQEASDVAASATAHQAGGRSAMALSRVVTPDEAVIEDRPLTAVGKGEAPKRII